MNVEKALRALRENGFDARWFATAAEAADALCAELKGKTIGIGGSVTVEQMGLGDRLSRENTVCWHWQQPAAEARKNAMAAEVYLHPAGRAVAGLSPLGQRRQRDGRTGQHRRHGQPRRCVALWARARDLPRRREQAGPDAGGRHRPRAQCRRAAERQTSPLSDALRPGRSDALSRLP